MMTDIHDVSKTLNYMCEGDMISGMGAWNVKEQKRAQSFLVLISLFLGRCTFGVPAFDIYACNHGNQTNPQRSVKEAGVLFPGRRLLQAEMWG
jgi:hypothetical protein